MAPISLALSPAAWPFWEWTGRAIELAVAFGVAGETYCHLIPSWALPTVWRSDSKRKVIGRYSAGVLVIALVLAVPVQVVKERITDGVLEDLGERLAPRSLTPLQQVRVAKQLRQFAGEIAEVYAVPGATDNAPLAKQIALSLNKANWSATETDIRGFGNGFGEDGVQIRENQGDPRSVGAGAALREALSAEHVSASIEGNDLHDCENGRRTGSPSPPLSDTLIKSDPICSRIIVFVEDRPL